MADLIHGTISWPFVTSTLIDRLAVSMRGRAGQ